MRENLLVHCSRESAAKILSASPAASISLPNRAVSPFKLPNQKKTVSNFKKESPPPWPGRKAVGPQVYPKAMEEGWDLARYTRSRSPARSDASWRPWSRQQAGASEMEPAQEDEFTFGKGVADVLSTLRLKRDALSREGKDSLPMVDEARGEQHSCIPHHRHQPTDYQG